MLQSETLRPVNNKIEYSSEYSMPEVFAETSSALLYRVRKSGKYFIIKTPKDSSGQSLAMLQREYELSLGMSHPYILTPFTYEPSTVVGPGIVMEYVDGRSLADFVAEKPSVSALKRVLGQLLQAVSYIHSSGLVHNDLKPDNIIVTRTDNSVRLLDFGLADNDAYYLARTLGCTPRYASPELLARNSEVDSRSDIYSLGVIIKEIFGRRYKRIAERCMQSNREKRYSNADELIKAVGRCDGMPRILISSFALLFVIASLAYSTFSMKIEQESAKRAAEIKTAGKDLVLSSIEAGVDSIHSVYADNVERETYYEFAYPHLNSYYSAMAELLDRHIYTIEDTELYSIASAHYSQLYSKSLSGIMEKIESKPSIYNTGLSDEEIEFYRKLIFENRPYVPYYKQ